VLDGGKVETWAVTLDELARELDVVIIVSSRNRSPRSGNCPEQAVTDYPRYLLEEANRFYEPAGALNVITVWALAHGEGLDQDQADDVRVRPIARLSRNPACVEPSLRCGADWFAASQASWTPPHAIRRSG
jgi:hypothetical protein